jgi:hypothetical protein
MSLSPFAMLWSVRLLLPCALSLCCPALFLWVVLSLLFGKFVPCFVCFVLQLSGFPAVVPTFVCTLSALCSRI